MCPVNVAEQQEEVQKGGGQLLPQRGRLQALHELHVLSCSSWRDRVMSVTGVCPADVYGGTLQLLILLRHSDGATDG